MRWTARRTRLESLAKAWVPPLQLSPVTSDVDEAREWLEAFKAAGVEGLVVKGASTRYQPGRREWVKVNSAGVRSVGSPARQVSILVSTLCGGRHPSATGVADG
jgi:ATP-dependent DNA ligase